MYFSHMRGAPVAVVGVGMTSIQRETDWIGLDLAEQAIVTALRDAGLFPREVDGLFMTPEAFMRDVPSIRTSQLCEFLDISPECVLQVECGGTTALQALKLALLHIQSGREEVAAVVGVQKEAYDLNPQKDLDKILMMVASYNAYQIAGVITPPSFYAPVVQRYMQEYGVTDEDLAELCVLLRENAMKHPFAQHHKPLTKEEVLQSRHIAPPIRLLHAAQMADGGACVILASEKVAKRCKKPVFITGYGEHHTASHVVHREGELLSFPAIARAAERAFEDAGRSPQDVDVAEIYGPFAGTELITYEEVGLVPRGKAKEYLRQGKTRIEGEIPINTSGGRLSLGHPPYCTPLLEVIEIVWQLRGEAGERQVENPKVGLAQAEHGVMDGASVILLEK